MASLWPVNDKSTFTEVVVLRSWGKLEKLGKLLTEIRHEFQLDGFESLIVIWIQILDSRIDSIIR